jgi:hypothetical protein
LEGEGVGWVVIGEDAEDDVAVGKCWSCRGLRVEGPMGGRAHGYKTDLSHALGVLLLVGFHFFKFVAKTIAPLHGSGVDLFKKAQIQCRMCSKAQEGFVMSCSSRFCFCFPKGFSHLTCSSLLCFNRLAPSLDERKTCSESTPYPTNDLQ